MEFSEYGDPISSSGAGTVSPKTWVGGLSVNDDTADSGLYLMGHRHYAGGYVGRFISRDPIGFAGGLNLYVTHLIIQPTLLIQQGSPPSV